MSFTIRIYGICIKGEKLLVSDEYIYGKYVTKFPGGGLEYGEGLIMVGDTTIEGKPDYRKAPGEVGGGNTQNMMVFVDDADAHCAYAREQGAKIVKEPSTSDYGEEYWVDRGYEAEDLEGHHWWFYTRVKEGAKSSARASE